MAGEDFDFDAAPRVDRNELLLDAARRIEALAGHLGEGDAAELDDRYGDLIRGLTQDKVEFGELPEIYPIQILELPNADKTSAAWRAALDDGFTFWWLRIPLLLFPRHNWAFTGLEVRIAFSPDEPDAEHRPRAYDILPNRRFDTVMRAGAEFTVGVGLDAHFAVDTGDLSLDAAGLPFSASAGAAADAQAGGRIQFGLAPIRYRMVAARVNHTDLGLTQVFWRLDGSEFFRESSPQLITVLQVPRATKTAEVLGIMQAYRRFTLFPVRLQSLIRELPEALRTFFRQGAPILGRTRYDLSPVIAAASGGERR